MKRNIKSTLSDIRGSKGFTLIELLVVIAIIGILSSVVLASLSTARNKGKDASIQSQMNSLKSAAEIYSTSQTSPVYATTGAAVTTCNGASSFLVDTASNALGLLNGISAGANGTAGTYTNMNCNINAANTAYAVSVKLPGAATWFCIDSSGKSQGAYASQAAALVDSTDVTCN